MEFNQEDLQRRIAEINMTPAEQRQAKIDRLIKLLSKIEKELTVVENTLNKLMTTPVNPTIKPQIAQKLATTARLKSKIQKAKLNLNYYFK